MRAFFVLQNKSDIYSNQKLKDFVSVSNEGKVLLTIQNLIEPYSISDCRRAYFAKIQELSINVGETKSDVHEIVKDNVLSKLMEEVPDLFTDDALSTTSLTPEAWIILLERLDIWAFINYNIIL